MRYLFTEAPLFVPGMDESKFASRDLERRAEEVEQKLSHTREDMA
jgi:hypothetical protein